MTIEILKHEELTTLSDAELDQVTGGGANPIEAVLNWIDTETEKVAKAAQHLLSKL